MRPSKRVYKNATLGIAQTGQISCAVWWLEQPPKQLQLVLLTHMVNIVGFKLLMIVKVIPLLNIVNFYPDISEVARTRLREEGTKYRSFFQTLLVVYKEEGRAGLYRGIGTQLIRQIPNTAIMMATYELVVYLLSDSH